ncbi:uncharacterized protein LOC117111700 [Anneissia japonica]|uniref:uncharacterized protein LOC117111700 n=1 Tax=Anneissia japonica TaxID=1529436 RepID=UPI0014256178|nr:uncharacterized protein LOC117111700 [Anneissia japonica]
MASSSNFLASSKRRSQSSPELIMMARDNTESDGRKLQSRASATRSLDLSPVDTQQINDIQMINEDPPIPVDAVTLIATDSGACSGGSIAGGSIAGGRKPSPSSTKSDNFSQGQPSSKCSKTLDSTTRHNFNGDNENQKGRHTLHNGAFAHHEANLITVEYDSEDDTCEDYSNKHKQRSRFDQWTNKFRTLFRGKDKEGVLDDKENRVQEASDSDEDNNCTSDYDKCSGRSRSQSLYGCLRKYVWNRDQEDESVSTPSAKKKSFAGTLFPRRTRSRSRNKKTKQNPCQPPSEPGKKDKQSRTTDGSNALSGNSNFNGQATQSANAPSHILTPIEQAELLDTGLPLPAGTSEVPGVEASQVERSNTIVTQDLYGQFGSHTQNGYIPRTVHTQIDYIHCLVPGLKSILDKPCYWGKIDRYQADALLENKPEGTYLLRDSAQEEFLFSVSFRRYGRSLHARLEQWSHRFSFDAHDPGVFSSDTVTGLLEHYKDPNCCMFFEPMLTTPLPIKNPHSLKALCRGVVCSNITYDGIHFLNIPSTFKEYLREYHYKQRVRVRRFEIDYLPQPSGRRQTVTNTCLSY